MDRMPSDKMIVTWDAHVPVLPGFAESVDVQDERASYRLLAHF